MILLRVEWVDSAFLAQRWRDIDDTPDLSKPIVSVGFRMKEENGYLFLAGSVNPDEDHLPWGNVVAIPVRAIVKKRRIGH